MRIRRLLGELSSKLRIARADRSEQQSGWGGKMGVNDKGRSGVSRPLDGAKIFVRPGRG